MIANMTTVNRLQQIIDNLRSQLRHVEAELEQVRRQTPAPVEETPAASPSSTFDLLNLSEVENQAFRHISRLGRLSEDELVGGLPYNPEQIRQGLHNMVKSGVLTESSFSGTRYYELAAVQHRGRQLPGDLWDLLESRLN